MDSQESDSDEGLYESSDDEDYVPEGNYSQFLFSSMYGTGAYSVLLFGWKDNLIFIIFKHLKTFPRLENFSMNFDVQGNFIKDPQMFHITLLKLSHQIRMIIEVSWLNPLCSDWIYPFISFILKFFNEFSFKNEFASL